jgi:hypothetical protein
LYILENAEKTLLAEVQGVDRITIYFFSLINEVSVFVCLFDIFYQQTGNSDDAF